MVSTGPPAAQGTTMVTGRVGQSSAFAKPADVRKGGSRRDDDPHKLSSRSVREALCVS
jgi:hypothetical protein